MRFLLAAAVAAVAAGGVIGVRNSANSFLFTDGWVADESFLPPLPKIQEMRAIYLTVNTTLGSRLGPLIALAKKAGLNTLVMDVQDARQRPYLNEEMKRAVRRVRFAGLYPVARLVLFQQEELARQHPELALTTAGGAPWKDRGGRLWLDPAGEPVWRIIAEQARAAAALGFGEINVDYIRFPADGRLENAIYPFWDKQTPRAEIITRFSAYLRDSLKKDFPEVQLTADVFGYLLLRDDDLGIGQSLIALADIFDYLYPMVYPSHYDPGNFNLENPAAHPYEVVSQSLAKGKEIFTKHQREFVRIRPWIQDFNLGATYTPEMVQAQMKAVKDTGLTDGWLVWNPSNRYQPEIFPPLVQQTSP